MGHFASLLIIMLLLLCNKGVLGYNEGETGPTDPTVSPTSRPSWLTSVRPIRSPQRTESPTLTPNGADSAAPSFAPSTKEKNRKTHPSDANEFPTDNLYYVYSGAVIVVAVATIYFCLRSCSDRLSIAHYSPVSTSDVTDLFPRPSTAPNSRDVELARFERMAGGSNSYPSPTSNANNNRW